MFLLKSYQKDRRLYISILLLAAIYFLLEIPFLDQIPIIKEDEPWYANVAYNFSIGNGFVNTNVGERGGDELFLFTFIVGVLFKYFGATLFIARSASVIGGLLCILGISKILKYEKVDEKLIFFIGILFIFSNVNYIIFRTVRPESFIIVFAIWAVYYLLKFQKEKNDFYSFLIGVLSSASFMCHPHGAIYTLIFGIYILYQTISQKQLRLIIFFILGCTPVLMLFFVNILIWKEINIIDLINNWGGRSSVTSGDFFIAQANNLKAFYINYTLGFKRVFILVSEIGVLLYGLTFLKKDNTIFLLALFGIAYLGVSFLALNPIGTRHFSQILIFSFVCFGLILKNKFRSKKLFISLIFLSLLYLLNNFVGDLYLIYRDYNITPYKTISKKIDAVVEDDQPVLTYLRFWFPLKKNKFYSSYTRWNKTQYNGIEDLVQSGEVSYIVNSDFLTKGTTGVSGRQVENAAHRKEIEYYGKVKKLAENHGKIKTIIKTKGYGEIEVWKLIQHRFSR